MKINWPWLLLCMVSIIIAGLIIIIIHLVDTTERLSSNLYLNILFAAVSGSLVALITYGSNIIKEILGRETHKFSHLHMLHGLYKDLSTNDVLQDFNIDSNNVNAVYFLFADVSTNSRIHASIIDEDSPFLRVYFNNNEKGYCGNIAIRPKGEKALSNKIDGNLKYGKLNIKARVPNIQENFLQVIGLSLRILDKRLTYWCYPNREKGRGIFRLAGSEWNVFHVDLLSEYNWDIFNSDGNYFTPHKSEPDFTVIAGLTICIGGFSTQSGEPGPGKGVIDIQKIWLSN